MTLQVVDRDEGKAAGPGQAPSPRRLRRAARRSGRGRPSPPTRRDVVELRFRLDERLADDGRDQLQVPARRHLGHDPAVASVEIRLRGDHVRADAAVVSHERCRGLVARRLEAEDQALSLRESANSLRIRTGCWINVVAVAAPTITTDLFEEASGIPANLLELGASVEVRRLDAGDYWAGPDTLVERKTVPDLHGSVCRGRSGRKSAAYARVVATRSLSWRVEASTRGRSVPMQSAASASRACGLEFVCCEPEMRADTALWLYRLSEQTQRDVRRDRPAYAQRPGPSDVPEAMLAAVPGLSVVSARALFRRFGSVVAVAAASPIELEAVPGIGPERARRLAEAMSSVSPSQQCCEGRDRAT